MDIIGYSFSYVLFIIGYIIIFALVAGFMLFFQYKKGNCTGASAVGIVLHHIQTVLLSAFIAMLFLVFMITAYFAWVFWSWAW